MRCGNVQDMAAVHRFVPQAIGAGQQPFEKGRGVDLAFHDAVRLALDRQSGGSGGCLRLGRVDQPEGAYVPADLFGGGADFGLIPDQDRVGEAVIGGLAQSLQGRGCPGIHQRHARYGQAFGLLQQALRAARCNG